MYLFLWKTTLFHMEAVSRVKAENFEKPKTYTPSHDMNNKNQLFCEYRTGWEKAGNSSKK